MPRVDLKQGEHKKHVARAVQELRDGFVIVAPLEHGYVYLADAFAPYTVRAMHVLRGAADGTAAQVLAYSADTVKGIARDIPTEAGKLMDEFWPGLLSLNMQPMRALSWDLGDDAELDLFSVRVPKSKFVKAVLKEFGPLAVASAARPGQPPMLKINRAAVKDWDVAVVFDNGLLKKGPRTTVVEVSPSGLRIVREGAISQAALGAVAPSLSGR